MDVENLKLCVDHRTWPLPGASWKFYQEWNDVLFLHWKVDPTALRQYIPKRLELDTFDGSAWVSLVAFTMENVRPRKLLAFPPISNFHEINIRTYIKFKEHAGVYFLSIEASNRVSSFLAKTLSGLPYRYSKMKRSNGLYESMNPLRKDRFMARFKPEGVCQNLTGLDKWLTERYSLVQDRSDRLDYFDVHHRPWSVHEVSVHELEVKYSNWKELFVGRPDKMHYSPGVEVLAWSPETHR